MSESQRFLGHEITPYNYERELAVAKVAAKIATETGLAEIDTHIDGLKVHVEVVNGDSSINLN